ncbi:MAG: hypothetical protein RLZZ598_1473 [Pseudomonadota bacterium]
MFLRFLFPRPLAGLILAVLALSAQAAATDRTLVTTEQVRAELLAHAPEGVGPGKPVWLGLQLTHQPHWHTYWKNPGDSGLPTTLAWTLPAGVTASEIDWPAPSRLSIGPLLNHGYEGTVLLPVALTVPADFSGDRLHVKLRADWLVCKTECIPEHGEFTLALPTTQAIAGHAAAFEAAFARRPLALPAAQTRARIEGDAIVWTLDGLPASVRGRDAAFYAETAGVIETAAPIKQQWQGSQWIARVPLAMQRRESPAQMAALLRFDDAQGGPAWRVEAQLEGSWPAPTSIAPVSPALQEALDHSTTAAPAAPATGGTGFWLAVVFALFGGVLLNLMPCVFPVLSLKVLSFSDHAHDRRWLAIGGVAYTVGVVASFVLLAGLLLALRAAGEQIGWGFQLQSPGFVAALAVLFTLIGLNLLDVFEFGAVLPGSVGGLRVRHPALDALLTGVLAVAIASPCTAPFMGAALGTALALPAWQALTIFAALGLGMALPYLALSLLPGLAYALPRPGVWMARLRALLAFPMFATVVWLVWVLGRQVGVDGAAGLLAVLVAAGFAAWAFGPRGFGPAARLGFRSAAAAGVVLTLALALPLWSTTPATAASTDAAVTHWQPWSAERVAELNAQGKPVFVDFTAAWCVTCQYNKRTTFANPELLAEFEARQVTLMRADWTTRDAAISAELARLGRSGVPVYALYKPGATGGPRLLSELPSVAEVRAALDAL